MSLSVNSQVNTQNTTTTKKTKKKEGGGPPPGIQAQLNKYGLQPQGSLQADLAAIQQAKSQQGQTQGKEELTTNPLAGHKKGGKPPMGPPPEIMAQLQALGLSPQGSKQADEAAIAQAKAQQTQGNNLNLIG